jgi:hypothetical protein
MTDPTVGRRSDAKEQLALYHSIESWWEKNREQTEWSDALGKLTAKGDLAAEQEPDRPDQLPATPLNER